MNQPDMDAGAVGAWPERYNLDELSAIQHAMNPKLDDERSFQAEYQNQPILEQGLGADVLTAEQICQRINRLERGTIPQSVTHLTAFIDVHQNLLYYAVIGWEEDFTGYIAEYVAYPDPQRPYFTLRDATRTLSTAAPETGLEGAIYAGLKSLTEMLLGRAWKWDDGDPAYIERCLIDANWGTSTEVIYRFCRQCQHPAIVMPSDGRFVGASRKPLGEYENRPGDRAGWNWSIPAKPPDRPVRHVTFDANFWKSVIQARLAMAVGDKGSLTLFGDSPTEHRLFADHLTGEYRVQTNGRRRTVDEWKVRPDHPDNHWLDCVVGFAVGASI